MDPVPDGRCYGVIDRTFDHLDDPRCDDRSNCIDKSVLKRIKQCLFAEELCDHEMVNIAFLHERFLSESALKKARKLRDPLIQSTDHVDDRDFHDDTVREALENIAESVVDDKTAPSEQQQREAIIL